MNGLQCLQETSPQHTGADERQELDAGEPLSSSTSGLGDVILGDDVEETPFVDLQDGPAEADSEEAEEGAEPEDLDEFDREVESWLVRLILPLPGSASIIHHKAP